MKRGNNKEIHSHTHSAPGEDAVLHAYNPATAYPELFGRQKEENAHSPVVRQIKIRFQEVRSTPASNVSVAVFVSEWRVFFEKIHLQNCLSSGLRLLSPPFVVVEDNKTHLLAEFPVHNNKIFPFQISGFDLLIPQAGIQPYFLGKTIISLTVNVNVDDAQSQIPSCRLIVTKTRCKQTKG